ncbi:MAG: type III polyketide synthase [Actinomycetota bacterium]|nr:type III polyketide synthase [Actinomycetota bacterium]MDP2288221.1 type III polyketide synthase [Actinomycetota bacterium]
MSVIAAVHGQLAPHRYPQAEITAAFAEVVSPTGEHRPLIERIHLATGIEFRNLAIPLDEYAQLSGFGEANDAFIRVALDLGEAAINGALQEVGLDARDIDLVMSTSVTGIATPSLDAQLVARVGFREDIKRLPIFGLGCVAGAAGIARIHDYLLGHPHDIALLLSVELCSLTVQRDDYSMPNIVASGLFGDGAAAVIMVGADRAKELGLTGPRVLASRSRLYPRTERTMGWDISERGFRVVLSAGVGDVISQYLREDVDAFLTSQGRALGDVTRWVCHPGGPRVLQAIESSLELDASQLDVTWRSLAAIGNLSSASVLHVLRDTMHGCGMEQPPSRTPGVVMAMGPGFCAELVLLEW